MKTKSGLEYAAGGVIRENGMLLLVQVETLEGQVVWTFPKGHIEKFEKAEDTAVREVEEETGYRCKIIRPLDELHYWFKRDKRLIKKTVAWFLMRPMQKTGSFDSHEIKDTRWVSSRPSHQYVMGRPPLSIHNGGGGHQPKTHRLMVA